MRLLQSFFGERGLFGFLFLYVIFVVLLLGMEVTITSECPSLIPTWTNAQKIGQLLKEVTGSFLGVQVTILGLLFPVAIALVTLIVQREDATSTNSDVQVYYSQTFAYGIGASGIALAIVLTMQLLWPAQFVIHRLGLGGSTQTFKILLTALHFFWLVINLVSMWHFLKTSLSFIQPSERAHLRRRFSANVVISQEQIKLLTKERYAKLGSSLLPKSVPGLKGPSFHFGSDLHDWGKIEVTTRKASRKYLYDVWVTPLSWVLQRWWKRCEKSTSHDGSRVSVPTLQFAPNPRYPLPKEGTICRRSHGVPLSRLERFIIKHCFRFKTAQS